MAGGNRKRPRKTERDAKRHEEIERGGGRSGETLSDEERFEKMRRDKDRFLVTFCKEFNGDVGFDLEPPLRLYIYVFRFQIKMTSRGQ